jgi:hypothetical protein
VDLADGDFLLNKVEINIHMLGALMLNGVGGEIDNADVIAVDKSTESVDSEGHEAVAAAKWPQPHLW